MRQFAALHKWPVKERTILLEGESDQRYFALADRLYAEQYGRRLIGDKIAAFPTGIGEDGGSFGLQRNFHPLRAIMDKDVTSDGKKIFHAIAVFDNDLPGVRGFGALTGQHLNYRKWRDVFLLQRVLPMKTRDPVELAKLVDVENASWKGMSCEIEDLVSAELIKEFVNGASNCIEREIEEKNGGLHCFFRSHAKPNFLRFVEENAVLRDVESIVELLKALRFHMELPPDGD